jgi:hypothetical protein
VNTNEGGRIKDMMNLQLSPNFLFAHNKRDNTSFNRASVIDKLEGQISEDIFRDALIRNIEVKETMRSGSNSSRTSDLIEQQKKELEHLERLEEDKKRKVIEDKRLQEKEVTFFYLIFSKKIKRKKKKRSKN